MVWSHADVHAVARTWREKSVMGARGACCVLRQAWCGPRSSKPQAPSTREAQEHPTSNCRQRAVIRGTIPLARSGERSEGENDESPSVSCRGHCRGVILLRSVPGPGPETDHNECSGRIRPFVAGGGHKLGVGTRGALTVADSLDPRSAGDLPWQRWHALGTGRRAREPKVLPAAERRPAGSRIDRLVATG
jgi:hypothetical protein